MSVETIKCVDYPEGKEGPRVEIEFDYEIPEDLAGCAALFGEKTVHAVFVPALRLRAQKVSKTISRKGEDVQGFMTNWKPSDVLPRSGGGKRDLVGDFMKAWADMPEERRAELMAQMNADKPAGRGRK